MRKSILVPALAIAALSIAPCLSAQQRTTKPAAKAQDSKATASGKAEEDEKDNKIVAKSDPSKVSISMAPVKLLLETIRRKIVNNKIPAAMPRPSASDKKEEKAAAAKPSSVGKKDEIAEQTEDYFGGADVFDLMNQLKGIVNNPDLEEVSGLSRKWFMALEAQLAPAKGAAEKMDLAILNKDQFKYSAAREDYEKALKPFLETFKNPLRLNKDQLARIREENSKRRMRAAEEMRKRRRAAN